MNEDRAVIDDQAAHGTSRNTMTPASPPAGAARIPANFTFQLHQDRCSQWVCCDSRSPQAMIAMSRSDSAWRTGDPGRREDNDIGAKRA
jgi:hypothetical protein